MLISTMDQILLILAFLLGVATALDCNAITRRPQTMPPTYRTAGVKADREAFEAHLSAHMTSNDGIPPLCDGALRIMTYNIHFHTKVDARQENVQEVRDLLRRLEPTVVVFQEVIRDIYHQQRHRFDEMLNELGFKHRFVGQKNAYLVNMIASKVPLWNYNERDLGGVRHAVAATVKLTDGRQIAIVGTHFEVSNAEARQGNARILIDMLQQDVFPLTMHSLLMGDFNAHWRSSEIQMLSEVMQEVFSQKRWPYPNYTCWAGTTIDFIFARQLASPNIYGTYVYQSPASDHLPVFVDIQGVADMTPNPQDLPGMMASNATKGKKDPTPNTKLVVIGVTLIIVIFVLLLVGSCLWYFRRK